MVEARLLSTNCIGGHGRLVTATTVGYGDYAPVTTGGRIRCKNHVFIMGKDVISNPDFNESVQAGMAIFYIAKNRLKSITMPNYDIHSSLEVR